MNVLKPQPTVQALELEFTLPTFISNHKNQHDALIIYWQTCYWMGPNRTQPEMLLPLAVGLISSALILLLLNHLPFRSDNRRGPRLHRSLPQSGETWRELVQRLTPLRFTQVGLPQTVAQCPGNRDSYCISDLNIPIAIRESTHVQRQGLQGSMILLLISRAVTD